MDDGRLSFNKTAELLKNFLEIAFHTILCLRTVYPPESFTRVKAYGVPVYQSRVPDVRAYIAGVMVAIETELKRGHLRSVSVVIKSVVTGDSLEQFLFETRYMDMKKLRDEAAKDLELEGTPLQYEIKLMLQAFLTRLTALDSQLVDFARDEERTFLVVIKLEEGTEPDKRPVLDFNDYSGRRMQHERDPMYHPPEGAAPWTPALRTDLPGQATEPGITVKGKGKARADDNVEDQEGDVVRDRGEPFIAVRSVETGVIDINLMVQECAGKKQFVHNR